MGGGVVTSQTCPVDGPELCGRYVRAGHLMCGQHWHAVPRSLKGAVWRAWRAYQKNPGDKAWRAYIAARAAALRAVAGMP